MTDGFNVNDLIEVLNLRLAELNASFKRFRETLESDKSDNEEATRREDS